MLNLNQELRLQQKLSPQQIQYIKLLQLPTLALEQRIQQELEKNPLLEEGGLDDLTSHPNEESDESNNEEEFDLEDLLPDIDDLYGYKARVEDQQQDREIPIVAAESMTDHLRNQKGYLSLDRRDTLIAEQIIGSIDEDGYLRREIASIVDDIAFNYREELSEKDVLRVLHHIQRLDPLGIAARSVQECLLIQLESIPEHTPGHEIATQVVSKLFSAFSRRHYDRIKDRLNIDDVALKSAIDLIQSCNPKPGEGVITLQENYVIPDFLIRKANGSFVIQLNAGNFPTLTISKSYREMIENMSSDKKFESAEAADSKTRQFLRSKIESAKWFIDAVEQRRKTMLSVMREIVSFQEAFFTYGEGHLRPLILKDIATRIGMDISTVSRVVNGKYVHCDFGVYELKYFFSEGVKTDAGITVSNKEVKSIITSMIEEEDKTDPLTDQVVTAKLKEQGYRIARRTVSKYRRQLEIPVARLRREIVLS
ncbi:MAG: RNA polymerase factor sigma-54 [Bacteroidetes bacterium]|nr:RNA polymerase factor sigma-54 [Bacteroidota bacterium]MCY4205734.1 RNA polymerase factor sigma-54 [Bacteroidota bacterium]